MSLSYQTREFDRIQTELASDRLDLRRRAALEDEILKRNTFMLYNHNYATPLADMYSGTLAIEHRKEGVYLTATIPEEGAAPSWIEDTVRGVNSGVLTGISPGFLSRLDRAANA